jgi:protein-L-isoaspartate(D-aspartate) O-methyltransferase
MRTSFIAILLLLTTQISFAQSLQGQREIMVRVQIENRGVRHQPTLMAMRAVQRHRFVPDALISRAYDDNPLPIGYGQTISQPFIVAYMTSIIEPKPDHKVLEIGCGSGYQAAVLAEIVSHVYTIEIVPELGQKAKKLLADLEYKNITVKTADGYYGWEEHGPFDAIVVTAAAEFVPPPLIAQLKDGGKMIIPVGSPFLTQNLILVEKKDGKTTTRNLMPVRFVPFTRNRN